MNLQWSYRSWIKQNINILRVLPLKKRINVISVNITTFIQPFIYFSYLFKYLFLAFTLTVSWMVVSKFVISIWSFFFHLQNEPSLWSPTSVSKYFSIRNDVNHFLTHKRYLICIQLDSVIFIIVSSFHCLSAKDTIFFTFRWFDTAFIFLCNYVFLVWFSPSQGRKIIFI